MARNKYFYNPVTCSYERVKIKKKDVFVSSVVLFCATLITAVALMIVFNTYFDTPTESALKKENKELEIHYASLKESLDEMKSMEAVLRQRDNHIYSIMYDTEPGDLTIVDEGIIKTNPNELYANGFNDQVAVNSFSQDITHLKNEVSKDSKVIDEYLGMAISKQPDLEFIPTIQPIDNPELEALVTGFGKRINPYHHGIVNHEGIDFATPRGTPVHTTASGKVILVKITDTKTGYGNRVEIDHGNGFITRYTHLEDIFVKRGDNVVKGSPIASAGISGGTIAPCVHYEIIRNGIKINPVNFFIEGISESDYLILLELALRENQSLD